MGEFLFIAPEGWTVLDDAIVQQAGGAQMFGALADAQNFTSIKEALLPFGGMLDSQYVKDAKVFNNEVVVLELME